MSEPNQRTVSVTWNSPFDGNSPIIKYIVQRREVSEIGKIELQCSRRSRHTIKLEIFAEISGPLPDNLQNWITELSNISANQNSAIIKDLKAATSYQFRVSAVNRVGEGYPSEPTSTISLPHEGNTIWIIWLFLEITEYFLYQLLLDHQLVSWDQLDPHQKLLHSGSHH